MISKTRLHIATYLKILIHKLIVALGIVMAIAIALSFTSIPYKAYHQLSMPKHGITTTPHVIITYSAEGMPAPETLMRIWTTAQMANKYPNAKVIVAFPAQTDNDTISLNLIKKELQFKGITSSRIHFTTKGCNTYYQSKFMVDEHQLLNTNNLLIVSSPEHLCRIYQCYNKMGFYNIATKGAFPQLLSNKLLSKEKDDSPLFIKLRYNFWNYLKYEITVCREYSAMVYYKLKGWV